MKQPIWNSLVNILPKKFYFPRFDSILSVNIVSSFCLSLRKKKIEKTEKEKKRKGKKPTENCGFKLEAKVKWCKLISANSVLDIPMLWLPFACLQCLC